MKSPRTAAPALAAPWGSGFPQKDPEELIQKSVMYYTERMEFISCIQQKSNHSGKEKLDWVNEAGDGGKCHSRTD